MGLTNAVVIFGALVVLGAFVSASLHAVVARSFVAGDPSGHGVDTLAPATSGRHDAALEVDFAQLIGVGRNQVEIRECVDHSIHCVVRAKPHEMFDVVTIAQSAVGEKFIERARWRDVQVVMTAEVMQGTF